MTHLKEMKKYLSKNVFPYLSSIGFSGSWPDFYRENNNGRFDYISFYIMNTDQSFYVEASYAFPGVGSKSNLAVFLDNDSYTITREQLMMADNAWTDDRYRLPGLFGSKNKNGDYFYDDVYKSVLFGYTTDHSPLSRIVWHADKNNLIDECEQIGNDIKDAIRWLDKHVKPELNEKRIKKYKKKREEYDRQYVDKVTTKEELLTLLEGAFGFSHYAMGLKKKEFYPVLIEIIENSDDKYSDDVRIHAYECFGNLLKNVYDQQMAYYLTERILCESEKEAIRVILSFVYDEDCTNPEPVLHYSYEGDNWTRGLSIEALGRLKCQKSRNRLLEIIHAEKGEYSTEDISSALGSLGTLGNTDDIPEVEAFLNNKSTRIKTAAKGALFDLFGNSRIIKRDKE